MKNIINVVHKLRTTSDPALTSVALALSTRQLLRTAKRFANFSVYDVYETIQRACLAK